MLKNRENVENACSIIPKQVAKDFCSEVLEREGKSTCDISCVEGVPFLSTFQGNPRKAEIIFLLSLQISTA